MNLQKQQLKEQLRNSLVQIGADAIENALRFTKDPVILRQVQEHLATIRSNDVQRIYDLNQSFVTPQTYSVESSLLRATKALLKLAQSDRWLNGGTLAYQIFMPCWDAAGSSRSDDREQIIEAKYHNTVLRPRIEQAFEKLRNAEKDLKAA